MMKVFTLGIMSLMIMSLLLVAGPAVAGNSDQGPTPNEFFALSAVHAPIAMTDAELAKVEGQDVLVLNFDCSCLYYVRNNGNNNNGAAVIFFKSSSGSLVINRGQPHFVSGNAGPPPNAGQ